MTEFSLFFPNKYFTILCTEVLLECMLKNLLNSIPLHGQEKLKVNAAEYFAKKSSKIVTKSTAVVLCGLHLILIDAREKREKSTVFK